MRAEGVFRLILNVPIFATQRYEVADKYVRTTVFEEGKSTSLAIKVSLPLFQSFAHFRSWFADIY